MGDEANVLGELVLFFPVATSHTDLYGTALVHNCWLDWILAAGKEMPVVPNKLENKLFFPVFQLLVHVEIVDDACIRDQLGKFFSFLCQITFVSYFIEGCR